MSEQQTTTEAPAAADGEAQVATTTTTTTTDAPAATTDDAGDNASKDDGSDDKVKKANREAKNLRDRAITAEKEAAELRAKVEANELAKLSEKEQAEKRAEKAETELATVRQQAQQATAAAAITSAARNFHDPDDAVTHLAAQVKFGDDGKPVNVAELVKQLAESKPHLVNRSGPSAGGAPGASAPGQQPTKALSRKDFLAEFGLH